MAESKKREYKRETVKRVFEELKERVMLVNYQGHICKVKDVIVFGSFVNTNKSKIHDLDVAFVLYPRNSSNRKLEHYISEKRLYEKHPFSYISYSDIIRYPFNEIYWFLKKGVGIISLHDEYSIEAATYQKHIYLMKNGVYLFEPLICEGTGIRIE